MTRIVLAVLVVLSGGCDLPRDAAGTLDRVRDHELRVGVEEHPPWVVMTATGPAGIEPELVGRLAHGIGARPVYRRGSESELLEALDRRELDLVVGGLREDSPWRGRVALTRPYYVEKDASAGHVFATAAGENGWLVHVERFLAREGRLVAARIVSGQ
jgi:polar amino acid transport system substrate-binding protein